MKKLISIFITTLLINTAAFASTTDNDLLLTIVPLIAAAQKCDPAKLSTCKTPAACKKAGAYWYEKKCNAIALGLREIRKMAGTWTFQYTFDNGNQTSFPTKYSFDAKSIHAGNKPGEYTISGKDVTFFRQHFASATYAEGIIYVHVPEYTSTSPDGSISIPSGGDQWYMSFLNDRTMVGLHWNDRLPRPISLGGAPDPATYMDPAFATKQ